VLDGALDATDPHLLPSELAVEAPALQRCRLLGQPRELRSLGLEGVALEVGVVERGVGGDLGQDRPNVPAI